LRPLLADLQEGLLMKAIVFSGQGSQFAGMGAQLLATQPKAEAYLDIANEILGFDLKTILLTGSEEELKQTSVTQPAVYTHAIALYLASGVLADCMAGHSLGEYAALVAAGVLTFETGLQLVQVRANAMQAACELTPSTMAAVLGLDDDIVAQVVGQITEEIVVPANENCPGQIVISGSVKGIELATAALQTAGAKRIVPLSVGGAFHSPLMQPAKTELDKAIAKADFQHARIPVYQNLDGKPATEAEVIRAKLMEQMVNAVKWTATIRQMKADGVTQVLECGPGNVLQGLVKKIDRELLTGAI
jgi:[acyl-carrier-protein] S-malonyltransferase